MKKTLFLFSVAAFVSCNSVEDKAKAASMNTADSLKKEAVVYPYKMDYSSSFEMGDASQAKIILDLWKDWESGNLSNSKDRFADSVEMHFADGSMIHNTRDSVLSNAQNFRNTMTKVATSVSAVIPVKSTDKNENWVTVWGKEVDSHKDGKVDSVYLQETWRFNKDGKVDLLYQYMAQPQPLKK